MKKLILEGTNDAVVNRRARSLVTKNATSMKRPPLAPQRELEVYCPTWTPQGIRSLLWILHHQSIKSLNLRCTKPAKHLLIALFVDQFQIPTLESLQLSFSATSDPAIMGDSEMKALRSFLASGCLNSLVLNGAVTDSVAPIIAGSFSNKRGSRLVNLGLGFNQITDKGAIILAAGLRQNSFLKKLNLESNDIGNQGAVALLAALETNACLQELNLSYNRRIDHNGAACMKKTLSKLRGLKTLHIVLVPGNTETLVQLVRGLRCNRVLQQLEYYAPPRPVCTATALKREIEFYLSDFHRSLVCARQKNGIDPKLWPYILENVNHKFKRASRGAIFHYLVDDNPNIFLTRQHSRKRVRAACNQSNGFKRRKCGK